MPTGAQEQIVGLPAGAAFPGLDPESVTAWLGEHAAEVQAPLTFGLIAAGGSNLTYRVTDRNGVMWILRRPPTGALLASAHDVGREYRILSGLRSAPFPVPRPVVHCDDPAVTGAPFYLMSYEQGTILRDRGVAVEAGPDNCRKAALSFIETLARLHGLDPAAAGLGDLSRGGRYVDRQLVRWLRQYGETSGSDPNPLVLLLHDRLSRNVPDDRGRGNRLTHGDYHIDNVVLDEGFAVKAVLDWELAALGDPIADLAWALLFWAEPDDQLVMMQDAVTTVAGFPTRDALAEVYAAHAGTDLASLPYFRVFALWKLSCLVQGSVYRSRSGSTGGLQQGRAGDGTDRTLERIGKMLEQANVLASEAGI